MEHRPIQECSCRAPVAITEGVVVGQPEVQGDGPHHLVAWWAQPSGICRVIQRALAHQPVQIQNQLGRQRLIPQLPDALHREEVVEDHPLGPVPWWSAAADHGLGHIPGCGSSLHLGQLFRQPPLLMAQPLRRRLRVLPEGCCPWPETHAAQRGACIAWSAQRR